MGLDEKQLFLKLRRERREESLRWQDLNLRMTESKSVALPLGDTPNHGKKMKQTKVVDDTIGQEGIRTPDTVVRSHVLYSTELQAHSVKTIGL